jgi:ATP-binding cassette subfamily F protein 3
VLEYLEHAAAPGTKAQTILDLAGSFLFRGDHVHKRIAVLSGGERARLCLAGLLLGKCNVLVLDEPGNHLDVETVEALAAALCDYKGTVLFTSHDRYFMSRVATSVVEVRGRGVVNYRGDYDAYLYAVNKEIDEGERELAVKQAPGTLKGPAKRDENKKRNQRRQELRKQLAAAERAIERLERRKQEVQAKLLETTDAAEALRLHHESTAIAAELAGNEQRWCELHEEAQRELD